METDGKFPDTQLSAPAAELADIVLTPDEKQQAQTGTDIKIILDVKDASGSISSADKSLVQTALDELAAADGSGTENKFAVGQHLDIGLFKVVGTSRSAISETAQKITITIAVPESLKNAAGGKARTYAVIRVHNGQAQLLEDLDSGADTITIATDRFSTYTIVYRDATDAGSSDSGNGGSTGDNAGGNTGGSGDNGPGANTGDTETGENTGDSGSETETGGNTGDSGGPGGDGDTEIGGNTAEKENNGRRKCFRQKMCTE